MSGKSISSPEPFRVVLGVTGGVAIYKSAALVRLLKERNCDVRVVMSHGAQAFITPLLFQALSGNLVHTDTADGVSATGNSMGDNAMTHIELARWAELVVVAPATANFIAFVAHGLAHDILTTLILATYAPIAIAPAMNTAMWKAPATQVNVQILETRPNILLWGPTAGELGCGEVGEGRMLEPDALCSLIHRKLRGVSCVWKGARVVITAGATREAIDPVRFITNRSSGKLGRAIAESFLASGAKEVIAIAGEAAAASTFRTFSQCSATQLRPVRSAQEMLNESLEVCQKLPVDIFIAVAAVCDFKPQHLSQTKLKKQDVLSSSDKFELVFDTTPDILATISGLSLEKRPTLVIGFAAETTDVENYAMSKLTGKRLDGILANDVSNTSIGFDADLHEGVLLTIDTNHQLCREVIERQSKESFADSFVQKLVRLK